MLQAISQRWWAPLIRGVCAIIFGLLLIASPVVSLLSLTIFFGIVALADAVVGIVHGIGGGAHGRSWWEMLLLGVVGLAVGLIAIFWPQITALALVYLIAWWAILRGILEIAAAIRLRKVIEGEWFLLLSGIVAIAFGILVFFSPIAGAISIMLVLGWYMIWLGILSISFAFQLRHLHRTLTVAAAH